MTRRRDDVLALSLSTVLSVVLAFVTSGVRPGGLRRPTLNGDMFFYYGTVRGLLDHGWYLHNDDLGYPYGSDLRRFPSLDQTHYALLKTLGLGSSDPILVTNAYFLLGFPMAAAAAFLFLRVVGIRPWLTAPLALSYAVLPWHVDRAAHLFLVSYWVVPLGMSFVLLVASGRGDLWLAGLSPRGRRCALGGGCVAAVAVGLGGAYYALMTCALLLLAVVLRGRRSGVWRGPMAWPVGVLLGTTAVGLAAGQVALALATGPDDAGDAFVRRPGAGEVLGGRFVHLLLPWSGTPVVGRARASYDETSVLALSERTNLGLVAVVGVWLVLALTVRLLLSRWQPREQGELAVLPWLVGTTLLLALAYVSTGLGALTSTVLPEVRGWNRYSVFVALTATAVVGVVLQTALERVRWRAHAVTAAAVVALVAVVLGTQGREVRDLSPDDLAARLDSSRAATAAVDRVVQPRTCPVAQWPHRPYPETAPSGTQVVYDELLTYLAGWDRPLSYGGVKGSVAGDWPGLLDQGSADALALQLASAGFCVLEVLQRAVSTPTQRALEAGLPDVLGPPVATDPLSGRAYFDLRPAQVRLAAAPPGVAHLVRDATLHPVQAVVDQGTSVLLRNPGADSTTQVIARTSALRVRNTSDRARTVTLRVAVSAPYAPGRSERARIGGREVVVTREPQLLAFAFDLAPHTTHVLPLTVTGPGVRASGRRVHLLLTEPVLEWDRGWGAVSAPRPAQP